MAKKKLKPAKPIKNNNRFLIILVSILGIALLGAIIISISLNGLDQRANYSVRLPETYVIGEVNPVIDYELSLGDSSLQENKENYIEVKVDTGARHVDGLQLALKFDHDKVDFGRTDNYSPFEKFYVEKDEDNGKMTVFFWPENPIASYKGSTDVARIYFTPISRDENKIEVECGAKLKTRITHRGSEFVKCGDIEAITLKDIAQDTGGSGGDDDNNGGGDNDGATSNRPGCDEEYPLIPTNITATSGPGLGEVYLTWDRVAEHAHHYTVTFGERWLDFDYGSPDIGDTDQFVIRFLQPGKLYYVVLTAVNECGGSSGYSDGVAAYAGGYTYSYDPVASGSAEPNYDVLTTDEQWKESTDSADLDDDFDYWYDESTPSATPETTYEPYVEDDTDNNSKMNLSKLLPWLGLAALVFLGFILFKFIKGDGDQELPPLPDVPQDDGSGASVGGKNDQVPPPFA